MYLQNDIMRLRALEPEDLDILYRWENDSSLWIESCATEPYSRYILKEYIAYSDKTIYEKKQLRLMVTLNNSSVAVGAIDLFDFDPFHQRAGVGILIDHQYQKKGYADGALKLLIDYSFNFLKVKQLYVNVPSNNDASRALFVKNGFMRSGTLQSWLRVGDAYIDVEIYQLVKK
jgi:diamine N-acetyltransferase